MWIKGFLTDSFNYFSITQVGFLTLMNHFVICIKKNQSGDYFLSFYLLSLFIHTQPTLTLSADSSWFFYKKLFIILEKAREIMYGMDGINDQTTTQWIQS